MLWNWLKNRGHCVKRPNSGGQCFLNAFPLTPINVIETNSLARMARPPPRQVRKWFSPEFFANFTLIGVWGMKIIMKVHQNSRRVSCGFFSYKMTLNGVWGQAHPKTYTRAQNSETLMSATFDVVTKCQRQVRKWLIRSIFTQINSRTIIKMFIN